MPRLEIYGTKGTICLDDIDPVDGPNLFGGKVLLRTADNYRWKGLPRQQPLPDWDEVPVAHSFNELSHRKNSRGIGLVDMAYAILNGRVARASGQLGLHCLEVMEGMLISAAERRFYPLRSTCQRPQALAIDFPTANERRLRSRSVPYFFYTETTSMKAGSMMIILLQTELLPAVKTAAAEAPEAPPADPEEALAALLAADQRHPLIRFP